jgi:hypothetical protein
MIEPTNDFTHLWNDLPIEGREWLIPHIIESQKLHIWQCKQKAITAHKRHMKEMDDWMKRLDDKLKKIKAQQGSNPE